jgi:putative DNA primase/helicase
MATLRDGMSVGIRRFAAQWIPESASGQVQRVGRRFAAVAAAGELATEAGITGWPEGEAALAAKACFHAWLESRGGAGNAEDEQMLRQVRRFFEAHGDARFTEWNRADDDHAPKTLYRAGFRKMVNGTDDPPAWEFYVFIETFRSELCEGFEPRAVLRVLRDGEYLRPDNGRPFDCRTRLPGLGLTTCYRIKSSIFNTNGSI